MPADMFDTAGLLERQEAAGIATTIVSDPHIWYGDLDPGDIGRTREYNDFAAELARDHPGRIRALGTVSPYRGEEHVREAERAVKELGLAGLALATSDGGRYLDAVPQSFWELVTALDVPLYYVPGNHDRLEQYLSDGRIIHQAEGCEGLDGRAVDAARQTRARLRATGQAALLVAGLGGSMRYNAEGVHQYTEAEMWARAARLAPGGPLPPRASSSPAYRRVAGHRGVRRPR